VNVAAAIEWRWQARAEPAAPRAVVAWGGVAQRLHARLGEWPEAQRARLLATASRDVLVVSGEAADLPWVDGVAYAAPCQHAPALWLPTVHEPSVPAELLVRALLKRHPRGPLLLWPTPSAIVPMDRQMPLSADLLHHIASQWKGGE
jgi:hypothetical protein